jgi:hypothetical protein
MLQAVRRQSAVIQSDRRLRLRRSGGWWCAMTRKIRVWCRDCGDGMDTQGCFNGGDQVQDEEYATKEEADDGGYNICRGSTWSFESFEVEEDKESTQ